MTQRVIPLDQLKFGHEADPPINARRVGRDDGIAELAASIGAHGLITPLKVKEIAGIPYVGIGNRRLAAMRLLVEQSQMVADWPVPCDEFDPTVDDPREVALAEQIMRAPLHEADQYEEFTALADAGLSEAAIASRFGIEPKRVKRILALGRLSPVILDAWRDGSLAGGGNYWNSRNPIEIVRAFTLAPSMEDQERVFKKLQKDGRFYENIIKSEFGAGDRDIRNGLNLVGTEAYVAAGGQIVEDLFGEDHAVSDPALVKKLVAEKLQAKVDEALKDGWSWAALADDLPSNWSYMWRKLQVSKKKATKADKAKSGVVVGLDYQFKMAVTYGVVKPEAPKKERAAKGEKSAPTISNAIMHRLSIQASHAVSKALADEPRLGLVALLAGIISWNDGPVKAGISGIGRGERVPERYDETFARCAAMSDTELFKMAAGLAGEAIDLQRHNSGNIIFDRYAAPLAAAIDANRMTARASPNRLSRAPCASA
jgi:ParB family chromosome partitioning protein